MGVITESSLVEVAEMGHHCVDTAQETFIFLDHIQLIGTATKTCDRFAKILGQNLKGSIGFFAADENLADYNKKTSLIREKRGSERVILPFVLPLIILLKF